MPKNAILSGFEILIIKFDFESPNDHIGAGPRIFGTDSSSKLINKKWRSSAVRDFVIKFKFHNLGENVRNSNGCR